MPRVKAGDLAPSFVAVTHAGERIELSQYRGKSAVVLFFYPRDETPICTQEACAFRDAFEEFVDAGAVVIGISGDSDESHRAFATSRQLPFHLVSDADGSLRRLYGVPRIFGLLPGRVTYVIDREGIVRLVHSAALASMEHVRKALDAVQDLRAGA